MPKELNGYVFDPAAPIHPKDQEIIEDILSHQSDFSLIPFTQSYFDGIYDYQTVRSFFLTPEQAEANAQVQTALKQTFRQLVSPYLQITSEEFIAEQAEAINRLYRGFRTYEPSSCGNPFERLMSLRGLQKQTGLKVKQIEWALHDYVHMGDLSLRFYLHYPYKNPRMKKAIHDSVHWKQGRKRLEESSIAGNLQKIRSDQRTIGVYPVFKANNLL